MKLEQGVREKNNGWTFTESRKDLKEPLVMVFGNRYALESADIYQELKEMYPNGHVVFGSTSGEILESKVFDESIVLTAIEFEKSSFKVVRENMASHSMNVENLGQSLVNSLPQKDLKHVFIISEGTNVNGSGLINGLEANLQPGVSISGGLCGDDARFERTLASYNENPKEGEVVCIGFYGSSLEITCANYGGWTGFGPQRTITKSKNNILHELDGKPALDLYKLYLGDKADDLPEAALLYPLSVHMPDSKEVIVRTILNIDETNNTMILAGDVPVGSKVQLMMSTVDDIAEGAAVAGEYAMRDRKSDPELALLVSCVGRKLVLDQRTEEEIEEVISTIGAKASVMGFYSYGELAPFAGQKECKLHNQTMTLTLFSE
ncbi:FIST C-terminal domain-containing protein [Aurantibacter crassamenti]|uniref:FIST signal transduction protein n=1 Tax=Aurantibacter crassamenti TaxID=1837375 RepID=UPI0019394E64|nr:FIST N-terminal domain-containing protein [Aurantibacter crassamenti]MBM1107477.1 FIST C-terminal domain-containing protein [Aurantibacter crassamenti]